MEGVDVPYYFLCPISLQIMKDPVTTLTGITYDRDSIEKWFFSSDGDGTTCPVTNQPLPKDSESELTPNHTLRRLIQGWCTANASRGVDRIPTPRTPVDRLGVLKLVQDLSVPRLQTNALAALESLASDSESNRRCIAQADAARHLVSFIISCFKKNQVDGAGQALSMLNTLSSPSEELESFLSDDNSTLMECLTWVLKSSTPSNSGTRTQAILLLRSLVQVADKKLLERLSQEFFHEVVHVLRSPSISSPQQATKAGLHVLLAACPWGSNRAKIVRAGAVEEVIEVELTSPDKRTSELDLGILDHLCACADGRARFLSHPAAIALVSKRILRVSPAADEAAVGVLSAVGVFSATREVLQEMLRVGAVSKLCMMLQTSCSATVKEKARHVLRLHSDVWSDSPCIAVYLVTRYAKQ